MNSDLNSYQQQLKQKHLHWESLCQFCGACCGAADGDPCIHLTKKNNKYICSIYNNRFGERVTVSGKKFNCVPIREILHESWKGDECCGYKKGELVYGS